MITLTIIVFLVSASICSCSNLSSLALQDGSTVSINRQFVAERFGITELLRSNNDSELNWFADFVNVPSKEQVIFPLYHALLKQRIFPQNGKFLFRYLLRIIKSSDRSDFDLLLSFPFLIDNDFANELLDFCIEEPGSFGKISSRNNAPFKRDFLNTLKNRNYRESGVVFELLNKFFAELEGQFEQDKFEFIFFAIFVGFTYEQLKGMIAANPVLFGNYYISAVSFCTMEQGVNAIDKSILGQAAREFDETYLKLINEILYNPINTEFDVSLFSLSVEQKGNLAAAASISGKLNVAQAILRAEPNIVSYLIEVMNRSYNMILGPTVIFDIISLFESDDEEERQRIFGTNLGFFGIINLHYRLKNITVDEDEELIVIGYELRQDFSGQRLPLNYNYVMTTTFADLLATELTGILLNCLNVEDEDFEQRIQEIFEAFKGRNSEEDNPAGIKAEILSKLAQSPKLLKIAIDSGIKFTLPSLAELVKLCDSPVTGLNQIVTRIFVSISIRFLSNEMQLANLEELTGKSIFDHLLDGYIDDFPDELEVFGSIRHVLQYLLKGPYAERLPELNRPYFMKWLSDEL